MATIVLGTNTYNDCESAITFGGDEVFRLRSSPMDEFPLVDFKVNAKDGSRIAVIAKNQVVFVADGYSVKSLPKETKVFDPNGKFVASAAVSDGKVYVYGTFYIGGELLYIGWDRLVVRGVTMSGNTFNNGGVGIAL